MWHRLAAVDDCSALAHLHAVVLAGDIRRAGHSVTVGAAEKSFVWDVGGHLVAFHANRAVVVGGDLKLHGQGVFMLVGDGGALGGLEGLLSAEFQVELGVDDRDLGGDARFDAHLGGAANVPGFLHRCGLGDGYLLDHSLAPVVSHPGRAHGLRRLVEYLRLVDGVHHVGDGLGVVIFVDGQDLVALVPVLTSLPGQEEGLVLWLHLTQAVLVLTHVGAHPGAGPNSIFGHRTVRASFPLQELKVVLVNQQFKVTGLVLFIAIGVVAVGAFARGVKPRHTAVFANVVFSSNVAVVDIHSSVGEPAVPSQPLQVNVVPERGERLELLVVKVGRCQRALGQDPDLEGGHCLPALGSTSALQTGVERQNTCEVSDTAVVASRKAIHYTEMGRLLFSNTVKNIHFRVAC